MCSTESGAPPERRSARGPRRLLIAAAAATLIAAAFSVALLLRSQPTVRWPAVLEAMRSHETVHGAAKIYLPSGAEWAYTVWGRVEADDRYTSRGMVQPVRRASEGDLGPIAPILRAMDGLGEQGFVTRLAAAVARPAPAREGRWGPRAALVTEFDSIGPPDGRQPECPDRCAVYLDPGTRSPIALELFDLSSGERRLRAWCEYAYNRDLPTGFGEAAQ